MSILNRSTEERDRKKKKENVYNTEEEETVEQPLTNVRQTDEVRKTNSQQPQLEQQSYSKDDALENEVASFLDNLEVEQRANAENGTTMNRPSLPSETILAQRMQREQQEREQYIQDMKTIGEIPSEEEIEMLHPMQAQKDYEKYDVMSKNMYGVVGQNYETEYDEYNSQEQKYIKPYGKLSKWWKEAGGTVKKDAYGNDVLDIEAQNNIAKTNEEVPDAISLLNFILPKGGYHAEDADFYFKTRKEMQTPYGEKLGELPENMHVIDTSYLTPEERNELKAHQDYLAENGIFGQNIIAYKQRAEALEEKEEKENSILPGLGRGVVKMLDFVGGLLASDREATVNMTLGKPETVQVTSPGFVEAYDKAFGTIEPRTARDRIIENIGSFLALPMRGVATTIRSAVGASFGTELAEQLFDWATLSNEDKIKELKKNSPIQKAVVGIVGAVAGDAGLRTLSSVIPNGQKVFVATEELKKQAEIDKAVKDIQEGLVHNSGKSYIKKIKDKLFEQERENFTKALEADLYKPKGMFTPDTNPGLAEKTVGDISKAQQMFKKVTLRADQETFLDILGKQKISSEMKAVLENQGIKLRPAEELTEGVARLVAKEKGKIKARDLPNMIVDETLKPFKEYISKAIEDAGEKYEKGVASVVGIEIDKQKLQKTFREIEHDAFTSAEQEKVIGYFDKKISTAKKVEDLVKINREINKELYSVRDDGIRYTMNQYKQGINDYFKEEAKSLQKERADAFSKLEQANIIYSREKEIIDRDRAILDKLQEGKDKYRKPENRNITSASVAIKGYKQLTTEQKERLLSLLPEGNASLFRRLALEDVKIADFGKFSDLELRTMFGKGRAEKAISYAKRLASNEHTKTECMTRLTESYMNQEITSETYYKMTCALSKGLQEVQKQALRQRANTIIKEQQLFQEAKFMKYLQNGDIKETVNRIKTADDIQSLSNLVRNAEEGFGATNPYVKRMQETVTNIQNKVKENVLAEYDILAGRITAEDTETNIIKGIEEIGKYLKDNKEFLTKLYEGNKGFQTNIDNFTREILPSLQARVQNFYKGLERQAQSDPILAKYQDLISKINKSNTKITDKFRLLQELPLFGGIGGKVSIGTMIGTRILLSVLRNFFLRRNSIKMEKLMSDPRYFARKFKGLLPIIKESETLMEKIQKDTTKSLARILNFEELALAGFKEGVSNVNEQMPAK